jgi:hypothetical protein
MTSDAYETYRRVREVVLKLKQREAQAQPDTADPSLYWAEELSNIDYMLEASPLVIGKLRQHAFHITGIRPYDYRFDGDPKRQYFEERRRALLALAGDELLVPEAEAFGGFGYRIDGQLYNVDTLKFFEVLVGMKRAGLLERFRNDSGVLWEIGAGWGGFTYQFKTLFPRTTCIITDFPELFLFSAVYLSTMFPQAHVVFCGADEAHEFSTGSQRADFVFVPHDATEELRRFRPDLLVNIASFQEMTLAQVVSYAWLAAEIGCPRLYSLNRERSRYNSELASVTSALQPYYQLREIAVLDDDYTKAMRKRSGTRARGASNRPNNPNTEDFAYRHVTGELRPAAATRPRSEAISSASVMADQLVAAASRAGTGATVHNSARYLARLKGLMKALAFGSHARER